MRADRPLLVLLHLAERQAKQGRGRPARRALAAYRRIGALRLACIADPSLERSVRSLLRVVSTLTKPLRAPRQLEPREPGRPVAFTDAELAEALQNAPTVKAAARRLGVHRSTVTRRRLKLVTRN